MPRFAANLSTLFTDRPLEARFAAAAACGFRGVELHFPYTLRPERLGDLVAMNGLELVVFNAPPGDWAAGERGLAALPGREEEFQDSIELALSYTEFTDCGRLHVMAGVVEDEEQWPQSLETYAANLGWAAERCAEEGVAVLVEAINLQDMPGYFLSRPDDAVQLLEMVDHDNLQIQYDLYHAQIMQGGLTDFLETHLERIAHVQVAGVPGRAEPDAGGEINWPYLFNLLDAHGYPGWVGCEYTPRLVTEAGLRWARDFGITPPAV
ncbi:2-oxo-tetronate isomerase [Pararhodospirillum oryzae]|uniref:Hydroxypyruvate isomerase n=1 Tax=Pararhodospirillum oryzae TaxID=478448 RepID=A0A512H6V2_9PROT|nr:2-oxo-tetronate isomerase [Pararhodospirillum oryzae]GEO81205.1 hydroxypyruvate isomerase [Pararhodospirillum oryzae]